MRQSVEDIVQSALTQLLARTEAAGEPMTFASSYLWKVANHAVIDEIRRRQRRPEDLSDQSDAVVGGGNDPAQAEQSTRIRQGVRDCLSLAKSDRRAAVGLYLQGLRFAEVATALRCERKRAENLVYRGLAALRECLAGKGLQP